MNLATWKSNKSLIMQEIRMDLKKKAEKGQPTPSRKEANRTWREEILGVLSEDQKQQKKQERQARNRKNKLRATEEDESFAD
jgi:hypothetical protein